MPEAAVKRDDVLRAYPTAARSRQVLEAAALDAAFDSYLRIISNLLPGGAYDVKVDFSHRGCWLLLDSNAFLETQAPRHTGNLRRLVTTNAPAFMTGPLPGSGREEEPAGC